MELKVEMNSGYLGSNYFCQYFKNLLECCKKCLYFYSWGLHKRDNKINLLFLSMRLRGGLITICTHLEIKYLIVPGTSLYQIGTQQGPLVGNCINPHWKGGIHFTSGSNQSLQVYLGTSWALQHSTTAKTGNLSLGPLNLQSFIHARFTETCYF